MKKRFSVLILTLVFVLAFSSSAFASFFVTKTNVGYTYLALDSLNDAVKGEIGEIGKHHFYTDGVSLIGLNKVPNLHLGFKTATSLSVKSQEPNLNVLTTSAIAGVIDYTYPISEAFSIGINANVGINILSLISRSKPGTFAELFELSGHNYISIWRPYFQAGGGLTLIYNLGYVTNINLAAGYNYNLAIAPWLDLFKPLDGSKPVQKDFHSFYVTLGAGISF